MLLWSFEIRIKFFRSSFYRLFFVNILNKISYASKNVNYILSSFSPTKKTALLSLPSTWSSVFSIHIVYFITIFISTRKCWFYTVFRYLSSDLLRFYSNFKPIFSVQLLLLFSFLLLPVQSLSHWFLLHSRWLHYWRCNNKLANRLNR